MSPLPRISLALKAARQLGPRQLGLYALYRLQLTTGYLAWKTRSPQPFPLDLQPSTLNPPPTPKSLALTLGEDSAARLLAEADEITAGQVRLFGGEPQPLRLTLPGELEHWTKYEKGQGVGEEDIKFIWEPGRFGWAFTLGRAFLLSGDERYPQAFWGYAEIFLEANPPFYGPHWTSAQEVALRLMAFAFALQVFADSTHTSSGRVRLLSQAIANHAARIPATLSYARSQNNNHLLSEAAGLLTAGLALRGHPQAAVWQNLGRGWFNRGIQAQIAVNGAYAQHSSNYQRLMLQLALWVQALGACAALPDSGSESQGLLDKMSWNKIRSATGWLLRMVDPETGRVPNLGPNDGAYIFPLTVCPFEDYRPVLQAAGQAFLGKRPFSEGIWDEMALWFEGREQGIRDKRERGKEEVPAISFPLSTAPSPPHILRGRDSWAYLRAARFTSRPGHADQLHLDLWWRGLNIARDPGTYLYNASPPWDNSLAHSQVHNTLTVNNLDQMTRSGRFLWLDWAQAEILARQQAEDGSWERLAARHDGYQRLGISHQRTVTAHRDGRWIVEDCLLPVGLPASEKRSNLSARLHWLLPDWPFEMMIAECKLQIKSPFGWITLQIKESDTPSTGPDDALQLVRAGELLLGAGPVSPILGWYSPTYGVKIPALSFSCEVTALPPFTLTSQFTFP